LRMPRPMDASDTSNNETKWILGWPSLLVALPVTAMVLCLYYYWFAIADRYIVFLYYHNMGPIVPDTTPFSAETGSRYWMAGLVATGAVMVLYSAVSWLMGRVVRNYQTPAWWRVWAVCVLPLLVGIPLITMTTNQPTLPLLNAAQTTLAALIGLAFALMPAKMAAERPVALLLLASDGLAVMLLMVNAAMFERLQQWSARGRTMYVQMVAAGLIAGVVWLLIMTGLRAWRRTSAPGVAELFAAGLCEAYLLMPLVHHVSFTDGYYYISSKSNFFASSVAAQIAAWLLVAAIAMGVTRLRRHLEKRRIGITSATSS